MRQAFEIDCGLDGTNTNIFYPFVLLVFVVIQ